jgi:hypothetical protein
MAKETGGKDPQRRKPETELFHDVPDRTIPNRQVYPSDPEDHDGRDRPSDPPDATVVVTWKDPKGAVKGETQ